MAPTDPERVSGIPQSPRERLTFVLRVVQTRLRFFVVLGAIFLVLAGWERLQRWRDWALDRWGGHLATLLNASSAPRDDRVTPQQPRRHRSETRDAEPACRQDSLFVPETA